MVRFINDAAVTIMLIAYMVPISYASAWCIGKINLAIADFGSIKTNRTVHITGYASGHMLNSINSSGIGHGLCGGSVRKWIYSIVNKHLLIRDYDCHHRCSH